MSGPFVVWVKLTKIESTSGFYRGIDQKRIFIEAMGRLLEPQVDGFIKNELKFKDDEILTAYVELEQKSPNSLIDLPEGLEGRCIGTCNLSRTKEESLRGRKTKCFRTNLRFKVDELTINTILALKNEWIRIEPSIYEDSISKKFKEMAEDESSELLIESVKVSAQYEM